MAMLSRTRARQLAQALYLYLDVTDKSEIEKVITLIQEYTKPVKRKKARQFNSKR